MKLAPLAFSHTDADPAKAAGRTSRLIRGLIRWSARVPLVFCFLAAAILAMAADDDAKLLPDGPGKEVIVRACLECHDASGFRKLRLNRDDWTEKVGQMVDQGAQATSQEQTAIIDYLVHNFGPDSKVRINTAPFSEIRVVLGFTNEETKAIIAYREQHGNFKELRELLNVPGVDSKKVEAKKEMLAF
jgi:competence protein ComEA